MDVHGIGAECPKQVDAQKAARYCAAGKRRKEASLHPDEPGGLDILAGIRSMASLWDIWNRDYHISSHRRVIGRVLTRGREIVNGEIRRYIDPSTVQQSTFNSAAVDVLEEMARRLSGLAARMDATESARTRTDLALDGIKEETARAVSRDLERFVGGLDDHIDRKLSESIASLNMEIEKKAWLVELLDGRIRVASSGTGRVQAQPQPDRPGFSYLAFENSNRGSSHLIRQKQILFLPYFTGCRHVLDIGCGRGEFIELLRENGIGAAGIDIGDEMISYARSRGLSVEKADALDYLERAKDGSFDGVFMDQVVEHLEPDYLVRLISACHRKMAPGGNIVIETLNPQSLVTFSKFFYMDPTHKKPLHWDTLTFLLASAGFVDIDTRFFSPVPESWKLVKVGPYEGLSSGERKAIETYNANIEKLNDILFGMQDFAVIGHKAE